jgi:hypothetical protein
MARIAHLFVLPAAISPNTTYLSTKYFQSRYDSATMGFLGELVSEFTHSGQSGQGQQQHQQHSSGGVPSRDPPPVSLPWHTEWDARDNRWLFVNQQTGERTFTYPGPGFSQQQGSYGSPQGGYGNNQGGYSNQGMYDPTNSSYQQQEHEKKQGGNGWKYAAAGAAGVAGGALLMHEGHEISTSTTTH